MTTLAQGPAASPQSGWLADLAREMFLQTSVDAVWDQVVAAAVTEIAGADHAGVTAFTGKAPSTPAATDDLVRAVDAHQYAIGAGPCLTAAIAREPVVLVEDLANDTRWPEFTVAVADLNVRSMLSLQLYTDDDTIGALNLYASAPGAFTEESVHTGTMLAAHAAVAAAAADRRVNLQIALTARDIIGQAKGILMERHKITAPQAFDLLIAASQRTNRKLRDVAGDLAETGELAAARAVKK